MNIKECREILTIIGKLDPEEAKQLFQQAGDKNVSDEELGKALKERISKVSVGVSVGPAGGGPGSWL